MSLPVSIASEAPPNLTWPEFSSWFSKRPEKNKKITAPVVWKHYRSLTSTVAVPVPITTEKVKNKKSKLMTPMLRKKDDTIKKKKDVDVESLEGSEEEEEEMKPKKKTKEVKEPIKKKGNKLVTPMKRSQKVDSLVKRDIILRTDSNDKKITKEEFSFVMLELDVLLSSSNVKLESGYMRKNTIYITLVSESKSDIQDVIDSIGTVPCSTYDEKGNTVNYKLPIKVE